MAFFLIFNSEVSDNFLEIVDVFFSFLVSFLSSFLDIFLALFIFLMFLDFGFGFAVKFGGLKGTKGNPAPGTFSLGPKSFGFLGIEFKSVGKTLLKSSTLLKFSIS